MAEWAFADSSIWGKNASFCLVKKMPKTAKTQQILQDMQLAYFQMKVQGFIFPYF